MATNFPTNIDTFTDQTSSDLITSAKWNNLQDSIEALEEKVGADSSAITTSHDYKLAELAAAMGLTQNALCPVGSIVAYVPGYFTDGSNSGFTYQMVSANTIADVNTLLNSSGWYVCNGAALNDADSGIFNGGGRYLPNLTDDRFLMGDTAAGGIGGANSNDISHVHSTGNFTLTTSHIPSHSHTVTVNSGGAHTHTVPTYEIDGATVQTWRAYSTYGGYPESITTGSGGSHSHTASAGNTGSGDAHNHGNTGSWGSKSLENRPKYLSCFYIMRVK